MLTSFLFLSSNSRHQLRLHMAIIRHAIMGDVTYEPMSFYAETKGLETRKSCGRMCLHAMKLGLPLIGGTNKSFTTPDPFVFIKDYGVSSQGSFLI